MTTQTSVPDRPMRRRDREITNLDMICGLLDGCDTLRVAMTGPEGPYVIPVSFGWENLNGRIIIYFHSARTGRKCDYLKANGRVCVEADKTYKVEPTDHGITVRYDSVIGFGVCELLTGDEQRIHALDVLCRHYGYIDYDLARCRGLASVNVYSITLDAVTGKRNPPVSG